MTQTIDEQYDLDIEGEKSLETGFRRMNYFNQDLNWHDKTPVARGGFGIEVKTDMPQPPPFGVIGKLRHQGKEKGSVVEVETMMAEQVEVAVIGVSETYTAYWPDKDTSKQPILMPQYFKTDDEEHKDTRGGISLFVVLRKDPDLKVYELPIKTFNVKNSIGVLNQINRGCKALAAYYAKQGKVTKGEFKYYALWVTLAPGETIQVGSGQKGNCTQLTIKWPRPVAEMTDEEYFNLRVTPEQYKLFRGYRQELETMMESGYRKPQNPADLPKLIEAYNARASMQPAASSAPRLARTSRVFDVNKMVGADYRFGAWVSMAGTEAMKRLDDLFAIAIGEANYHIEDAVLDAGYEQLMDIPPDILMKDLFTKVIAGHALNQTRP